jgi:hypothetical protein
VFSITALYAATDTPTKTPIVPVSTITPSPTLTPVATLSISVLGTSNNEYSNVLLQFEPLYDTRTSYTVYYGLNGEYVENINQDYNYTVSPNRFVYELQHLNYFGTYNITVTAHSPDWPVTITSNAIQVRPFETATPTL